MKKLKILYHHRVAAQDGQSVHIRELTDSLKELGHDIIFVGPSMRPSSFGEENKFLGLIRKLLPKAVQELLEILYGFRAYSKLYKAYKQHQPDILYERYNLFLTAGARLKKKTGIPYLLEVNSPLADERSAHGGLALKNIAHAMEKTCWTSADMSFPVTQVLRDIMHSKGASPEKMQVIHNGINQHQYETLDGANVRKSLGIGDALLLGFTGFLREWHRLDRVIQIIADFDDETSPHLLVVGDGPAVDPCKELAEALGISHRIHFTGLIERSVIPEYVSAMDITLQPAVTDYASPLKIFEYMAAETAIVAPDQPNIREILTHQENAVLFEPDNQASLEAELIALIKTPEMRIKLGENAKRTIEERGYTWAANATRVVKTGKALLKK